ncbi:MAG: M56 family metallopeptidase, partial [Clostridiaceae bacterium]|nr:M56 family metallopeptidase [Clostridiaceae bacterium]
MDQIFLTVLNMSITATYVLLVVLILRLLLKRAPKWISYALWSVVLFRLVSPFSFISSFSLLSRFIRSSAITGQIEYIPTDIIAADVPKVDVGIPAFNSLINDALPWSANSLQGVIVIGNAIWLAGFASMLVYSVVSYIRLKRRISSATRISGNVYESDKVESPFVCGFFKPGIYLPVSLSATNQAFVLQHELTHLKRFDHVIKPFAFLVLAIHWFNPMIWLAYRLMSRDMEMSCDERVVQELNHDDKADYGGALVQLAMKRPIFSGSPLAFGESATMGRVRNILNYRKPAFWVTIVVVLTLII